MFIILDDLKKSFIKTDYSKFYQLMCTNNQQLPCSQKKTFFSTMDLTYHKLSKDHGIFFTKQEFESGSKKRENQSFLNFECFSYTVCALHQMPHRL